MESKISQLESNNNQNLQNEFKYEMVYLLKMVKTLNIKTINQGGPDSRFRPNAKWKISHRH